MPVLATMGGASARGFRPPRYTDPNFSNVSLLIQPTGAEADGSTSIVDLKGHAATVSGNAQYDTGVLIDGRPTILFDGTGDRVSFADHADFEFGSGDFTIEFPVIFNSVSGNAQLVSKINSVATDFMSFGIAQNTTNLQFYASSSGAGFEIANAVTFASGLTTGVLYRVAVNRTGTAWRGYLDGVGASIATSSAAIVNSAFDLQIGGPSDSATLSANIGPVRLTKGVGRYPANYTPRATPYPVS
jgi:hypothetical protein